MADITIVVEESVAVAVDAETNTALIVEVPDQGPAGPTGPTGPSGADGATWYTDAGAPSGALGEVGDMYLNYSNGDIYEKTGASTWTARMNVATGYTRLHDMTSTDDHSAGNYKIFYSDGSGHVQELVHGTANKVLTSNGATSAPSWESVDASPLTTKGDVYTYSTVDARLPVGSNGQVLTADSGETTGLKWAAAGTSSPLTTKGDLYTYSTDNARLPVGTDGYVLKADSGEATGLIWAAESGGTGDKIEEGNSSVEVVDAGTGYVSTTVDSNERFRVKNSRTYIVGGKSPDSPIYDDADLMVQCDTNRSRLACFTCYNGANYDSQFVMGRARGSVASATTVTDGDRIGGLNWTAYDGSSWVYSGSIFCYVDGTVSSNTVPKRIEFHTSTDNDSNRAARFVILSDGTVRPGSDGSKDFGTSSYRWKDIYASNGTIQTSDRRLKRDIEDCDLGLDFINELTPVSYKMKDYTVSGTSYSETTDEEYEYTEDMTFRRTHYGMVAQDVETTMSGLGISSNDFAGLIYDKEVDRYGLRYEEFIAPMIKATQELSTKNTKLEEKVDKLEDKIALLENKLNALLKEDKI